MKQKTKKQLSKTLNDFYERPVAKVSLELFLTLGTVIFFAVFAIRPTLLTMSDLIKEIEDKKKLDQQLSQKVAALSTAQSEYLKVESRLPVLDQAIPSKPALIKTLKIIEKLASEQSLAISSLMVNEVPPEKESDNLTAANLERKNLLIKLVVTGDYLSIRDFVESLRLTQRTFIVDTILFNVDDNRGQKQLKANISLEAPFFTTPGVGQQTDVDQQLKK
ncbi:MAG: type 4a pilus biogenesis protein PilO [Candidatus Pacebacteria bacterium]|nr:type 4a pilus biogenesis protein PilO [Candidatus Paceibacterota bacterium]